MEAYKLGLFDLKQDLDLSSNGLEAFANSELPGRKVKRVLKCDDFEGKDQGQL